MLYFAYGSNMSINRLAARVKSASKIGLGQLGRYKLAFNKLSKKDGSGKCNVYFTGDISDAVHGVLFSIADSDIPALDKYEGCGYGYERVAIAVRKENFSIVEAQTYMATSTDSSLMPMDWYKEHVLRGAKENGLPNDYIEAITNVRFIVDSDVRRKERELSIYIDGI